MAVDFEKEGLLEGVEGEDARKARLELLGKLSDEGCELDELRDASAQGRLALLPVEMVLAGQGRRLTQKEVAEEAGLDMALLKKVWRALGMPEAPEDKAVFSEEDLEAAKAGKQFLDAGIPEEEFLALTRSMSQAVSGMAASVGAAFAQALLQPGDNEAQAALRFAEGTRELTPRLDDVLRHMMHVHLRERARNAVIGETELSSGKLVGAQVMAVCFADLVGFTKLGERVPSEELGSVAGKLAELAADVAEPPVRMVKTIGDAAMLVSDDADCLLKAALDLVEAAENAGESFPSVHAGLAIGETLPRGGDYYGAPVNLASRLTDFARPASVVATKEVSEATERDWRWTRIGRRKFKGLKGEVEVLRARPPSENGDERSAR